MLHNADEKQVGVKMSKTKIDWCDEVWNPVTGCSKVSEGCQNCYAEKMGLYKYRNGFKVECHDEELSRKFSGKGKRIFVNSMSDLFHDDVYPSFLLRVLAVIRSNPQHTFIVLTKRAKDLYFLNYIAKSSDVEYQALPNLWLGVSVENQSAADERIPLLLQTPATLRFVSVEPMLEGINLSKYMFSSKPVTGSLFNNPITTSVREIAEISGLASLDWVICGGESGTNARPLHPDWVRSLRDQCASARLPFFFKQWGQWEPFYDRDVDDPDWRNIPAEIPGKVCRINIVGGQGFHGKRIVYFRKSKIEHLPLLDGERWNQFPKNVSAK